MKIQINNLGPIRRFDFDLTKNLNVIFGKNNIGKSYAITAVYLIVKNLINESLGLLNRYDALYYYDIRFSGNFEEPKVSKEFSKIESGLISKLKEKEVEQIVINSIIEDFFSKAITQNFVPRLEQSFSNSFASIEGLTNKFSNEKFAIHLIFNEFSFDIIINNKNKFEIENFKLKKKVYVKKIKTNRKTSNNSNEIITYVSLNKIENSKPILSQLLHDISFNFHFSVTEEINSLINNVYFLPASRSGLYQALSTFSAVIAELSKSRNFLTNKIELPNISEPVSDYFLYLSKITDVKRGNKFSTIARNIEKSILEGEIKFNKDNKKIVFRPNNINTELDLSVTSSMISEIAPIVAYLKYIISRESRRDSHNMFGRQRRLVKSEQISLIFIEEPEAHLHPSIQVKLMEFFALLSNSNIKIVMTSHSNYMFNKLSNLILEKKINHKDVGSYLMRMTKKGSIVDDLAMKSSEEGIVDENFGDIAEELYNERLSIYDKLNLA
ncbi:MAG: AAA family ATPase [Bacteroidia bacterium]